MASAQVVETSVTNNSPSQDSNHPDDLFQSRNNNILLFFKWESAIHHDTNGGLTEQNVLQEHMIIKATAEPYTGS